MIESRSAIAAIQRILIVKLADHGDAILATPAIAALRETYPYATIDVLTTSNGALAFALCPAIDRIITMDKHAFDSPRGMLHPAKSLRLARLVLGLRRNRYDAIVLLQHLTTDFGTLKYRWLCLGISAPIRAGLDNGQGGFLTHRAIDYGLGVKSVYEYNVDVVAQLGANNDCSAPLLRVPDAAHRSASALLDAHGVSDAYVVIHPSVGGYSAARNWSPERFAAVATEITKRTSLPIVLVGASDAVEASQTIRASAVAVDLVGKTNFSELAAILDNARLVIGADSGVAHLAAALQTPILAIFGPSNHRAWRPIGATILSGIPTKFSPGSAFAIRSDIPCSPCFYTGYSLGRRDGCQLKTCLTLITPQQVTEIAIKVLTQTDHPKSTTSI